ncbi:MAG: hypothetical protein LBB60_01955 [Desulfovibrio sp.]|jgi:hypothetical protein|nr:hypothetical protein [Desulfovibrio sp.]
MPEPDVRLTSEIFEKIIHGSMRNKITKEGVDLYPSMKKISTAKISYGLPENEKIYAIIDATVFGSARNGMGWQSRHTASIGVMTDYIGVHVQPCPGMNCVVQECPPRGYL